ncbi:hypothetical protein OAO18_02495 [Francisellaceae bacterium]|nr:hypothetical protein [Francisellaceae bacterium]
MVSIIILLLCQAQAFAFNDKKVMDMYEEVLQNAPSIEEVSKLSVNNLAWYESYWLQSYINMFLATKDYRYFILASRNVKVVMKHLEKEEFNAFQSGEFSKGKKKYVVMGGMILLPILQYLDLLRSNRILFYLNLDKFHSHILIVKELVSAFDEYWHEDKAEGVGWYLQPSFGGNIVFNQQNVLGSVFVLLWRLTGNNLYKKRATYLAGYFKKQMKIKQKRLDWAISTLSVFQGEDISHAALNVQFIVLSFQNNIVFGKKYISYLINTFNYLSNIYPLPNDISGKGKANQMMQLQYGRWGVLAPYSQGVRAVLYQQLLETYRYNAPTAALSLSYLLLPRAMPTF